MRDGGKCNDLKYVGKDAYHHALFEISGSWSFGNYFKKEDVDLVWVLLVNACRLDVDKLCVAYFEGNKDVPKDTEIVDYWKNYLSEERVIRHNAKDNFWEIGETGPCGLIQLHLNLID